jgi:hypothetical protein
MAAKSKQRYDYVAHVQRESGVVELAGTREDYSMKAVYNWLWHAAHDMCGWLLTEQITPAEDVEPSESRTKIVCTSEPPQSSEAANDEVTSRPTDLGCAMVWGTYKGERFSGAARLTFKEKEG